MTTWRPAPFKGVIGQTCAYEGISIWSPPFLTLTVAFGIEYLPGPPPGLVRDWTVVVRQPFGTDPPYTLHAGNIDPNWPCDDPTPPQEIITLPPTALYPGGSGTGAVQEWRWGMETGPL